MLRDLPRAEVPPLVVAGRTGWLFAETRARLEYTPASAGKVLWLDGPSDPELAWCYAKTPATPRSRCTSCSARSGSPRSPRC